MGTMFFCEGLDVQWVRSPEFIEAVRTTYLAPLAYTPPGYNILRTRLLDDEVIRVEQQTKKRRRSLTTYGATICSDGWSDIKNHPLINFMTMCPEGEIFEGSVDASGNKKQASGWLWRCQTSLIKSDRNWWYKFILTMRAI